jgi:RNA recognition motif-containing protein
MIPPRGCAYVVLTRRKDAAKAVEKMKGIRLDGNLLKVGIILHVQPSGLDINFLWFTSAGAENCMTEETRVKE